MQIPTIEKLERLEEFNLRMNRLQAIIADLENRGYKTKRVENAGQGRNGLVYKLWTENNEEYALKIVSGNKLKNGNSRADQEAVFTRYLDCIGVKRHPQLKEYSAKENWIFTTSI